MRVRLRGINSISKKLADGTRRTYWYAWKGGPPLRGEPGTPEFVASYNEAAATKQPVSSKELQSLLDYFQTTTEFTHGISARTRSDYVKQIKIIEQKFGDFPIGAMTDRRTRGIFMAWRDELAVSSRRQADYAWVVLARVLSWGIDRGLIAANPCARGGGFIVARAPRRFGPLPTRPHFSNGTRASASAAVAGAMDRPAAGRPACGSRGRPMTAGTSGCAQIERRAGAS